MLPLQPAATPPEPRERGGLMLAADPNPQPRSRKLCPMCEATPGGCSGLRFIAGRTCCSACSGDHDNNPKANP